MAAHFDSTENFLILFDMYGMLNGWTKTGRNKGDDAGDGERNQNGIQIVVGVCNEIGYLSREYYCACIKYQIIISRSHLNIDKTNCERVSNDASTSSNAHSCVSVGHLRVNSKFNLKLQLSR